MLNRFIALVLLLLAISASEIPAQSDDGPVFAAKDIRFTGLHKFSNAELATAMKQCLGDARDVYEVGRVDYCAQTKVRTLMFSRGYWEATIGPSERRFNSNSVELALHVIEKTRYRLGEISFIGQKAFTETQLRTMLGQTEGDIADGESLQDFVFDRLHRAYADKGFIQYAAGFEPEFHPPPRSGDDGRADVKIRIDEGLRYKVKIISFSGVDVEQQRKLLAEMRVRPNDIFNRTKFEEEIKRLNDRKEFALIDRDADVGLFTDEESSDIEIKITLRPRTVY